MGYFDAFMGNARTAGGGVLQNQGGQLSGMAGLMNYSSPPGSGVGQGTPSQQDGFWDKLQGWFESPGGAAAVSPYMDYLLQVGMQPPQFTGMNQPGGQPLQNPGANTINGLLQAIMAR